MTQLTTYNGTLPFGSPLSPILCAHVHGDMFGRLEDVARRHGLTVTAWVDDVVVSGRGRLAGALWDMRRLVAGAGLRTHKVSTQKTRKGASVTGTTVLPGEVRPSNDVHLKIRDRLLRLEGATDPGEQESLYQSLVGLHTHCLQVYAPGTAHYERALKRKQWLCREWKALRERPSRNKSRNTVTNFVTSSD